MAKNTRSGLGRGLNSLLGGSAEEAVPAEVPKKKRDVIPFDDEASSESAHRKPLKPTAAKSPLVQSPYIGAQRAPVEPRTGDPHAAKEASFNNPVVEETASIEIEETVDKGNTFIEEDDHVIIKEVKERNSDEVPIGSIKPNPDQPRTNFKEDEVEELAASIERNGLLQPILVRKVGQEYQIIAGERRWQACKKLGHETVPVRIRTADDDKALELALVENVQRSDLNPIEEAYGYRRLMERKGFTQSEVAETVSKGRSTIANALRLLELPEDAQQLLFEEKITAGHARAILSIPTKEGRQRLTDKMVKEKISVREAETLARLFAGFTDKKGSTTRTPIPNSFKTVARALREALDTNVRVKTVKGKNKIEIEFQDEKELERLFEAITAAEAEEKVDETTTP